MFSNTLQRVGEAVNILKKFGAASHSADFRSGTAEIDIDAEGIDGFQLFKDYRQVLKTGETELINNGAFSRAASGKRRGKQIFDDQRRGGKHFRTKRAIAAEIRNQSPERAMGDTGHRGKQQRRVDDMAVYDKRLIEAVQGKFS
jgi:hypothetical protein